MMGRLPLNAARGRRSACPNPPGPQSLTFVSSVRYFWLSVRFLTQMAFRPGSGHRREEPISDIQTDRSECNSSANGRPIAAVDIYKVAPCSFPGPDVRTVGGEVDLVMTSDLFAAQAHAA